MDLATLLDERRYEQAMTISDAPDPRQEFPTIKTEELKALEKALVSDGKLTAMLICASPCGFYSYVLFCAAHPVPAGRRPLREAPSHATPPPVPQDLATCARFIMDFASYLAVLRTKPAMAKMRLQELRIKFLSKGGPQKVAPGFFFGADDLCRDPVEPAAVETRAAAPPARALPAGPEDRRQVRQACAARGAARGGRRVAFRGHRGARRRRRARHHRGHRVRLHGEARLRAVPRVRPLPHLLAL